MRTPEEVLKSLVECSDDSCLACDFINEDGCEYYNKEPYVTGCVVCDNCLYGECGDDCDGLLMLDAAAIIRQLLDENRALRTELMVNRIGGGDKEVEADKKKWKEVIAKFQEIEQEDKTGAGKPWGQYWQNICDLNARQEAKGKKKYGVPLEENTTLTTTQRIEHAQEEAIDLLKYLEHLKQVANDGITANDYQRAAMRTAGDDEENYLANGAMGLCGESGEVADLIKKHLYQGHELDRIKVVEELGDVFWYGALIAEAVGATLSEVMLTNEKKLEKRYPSGFSKERSIHRSES